MVYYSICSSDDTEISFSIKSYSAIAFIFQLLGCSAEYILYVCMSLAKKAQDL